MMKIVVDADDIIERYVDLVAATVDYDIWKEAYSGDADDEEVQIARDNLFLLLSDMLDNCMRVAHIIETDG